MIRSSVQSWAQPGPGGTGRTSFDVTVGVNPGPPRTATLTLLAKWSGDPLRTLTTVQVTQAGFAIIPPANEEISYFHTDAIGSVRMITGATGNVLARYDYLPFGTEWTTSFSTTTNTVKFTGQERDPETANGGWTAQDYFGARSYQNQIGRFTSPDDSVFANPFDPQSMNLYAYAYSSPLRWIDPTGHEPECAYSACVTAPGPRVTVKLSLWAFFLDSWNYLNEQRKAAEDYAADLARRATGQIRPLARDALDPCLAVAAGVTCDGFLSYGMGGSQLLLGGMMGAGAARGLGTNPFLGKTAKQIADRFVKKGFVPRGPAPLLGRGTFVNPRTGRAYHIDAGHQLPKGPHVGVLRPRGLRDALAPRDYPLGQ